MSNKGHRPQRTCLGCGTRDERARMIRLAITDQGQVEMDDRQGRGGYLHRTENCWGMFINRKSQFRAFHAEISRAAKEKLIQQIKARDWE